MNNMRYTATTAVVYRERKFKYEKKDSNCNKNLYHSSRELCVHMAHIISMRSECEKKAHRDGYNITVSTITAHIEKKQQQK